MKKAVLFSVVVAAALVLLFTGYQMVGAKQGKSVEVVKRDDAEFLSVDLEMGVGSLHVSPGSKEWVEAQFEYDHSRKEPVVTYKRSGTEGHLEISEKRRWFQVSIFGFNKKSEWNIQLNEDVPTELEIETGVSDSNLDLRRMNLTNLDIDTGVGDVTLDLSGERKESFDVTIDSGVGDTKVYLPEGIGVKIKIDNGVGDLTIKDFITKGDDTFVNEAYEHGADVIMEVDIDMGVGDITLVKK
ncbi:toast rack family protein [Thalassobacillus sp. B23F22_16]|uniref:toast rack family protein n=1 Tax=Thalassobacillus sp. B23F22_16 TaxID=3459513 RepID=UPI00373E9B6C